MTREKEEQNHEKVDHKAFSYVATFARGKVIEENRKFHHQKILKEYS